VSLRREVQCAVLILCIGMVGQGLWFLADATKAGAVWDGGAMEEVTRQLAVGEPDPPEYPPEGGANQAVREWTAQVVGYVTWITAVNYITAIVEEQEEQAREEQERERQAAEAARLVSQQRVSSPQVSSGGGGTQVTGQCGGATNGADRFIGRESGGDPNVYNTQGSGAWGCYQIMPATWRSSCSDLGQHGSASPAAQAECASRLPLSAWGG
jgi:hypothetical protein